ncbi:unnamed protein product [Peronospora belbahrii]|uniref:Methyltransferase domain-containing protein n=1 Tax=Peronospora belbahrii TaxID=622444 RepID=A0AAU9L7E3_9STRA|nr:unnamed protein product [Peronospora belbahrii]
MSSSSSVTQQHESVLLGPKLAPFTPSGDGVLVHALDLLALRDNDVLLDLGCGDARILVHAADQIGARCIGVEYNENLVQRALTRVEKYGVQELVDIRHGDALEVDLTTATAMFLYLVPEGIKMLLPKYNHDARETCGLVASKKSCCCTGDQAGNRMTNAPTKAPKSICTMLQQYLLPPVHDIVSTNKLR